jgi:hypothetical protein
MQLRPRIFKRLSSARSAWAMTLLETMTAMSVFVLMIGGMLQLHVGGLMHDQLVSSKAGASDSTRVAFDRMLQEVRGAKTLQVGTNSGTNFYAILSGSLLRGNALRVCLSTNTNNFILYYFDPNNGRNEIRRLVSGGTTGEVMVSSLNNTSIIFQAEDYTGTNVLTGVDNHTVISTRMELYQYRYPLTRVGSGYLYDYYKLEFKATSRNYN